MSGNVTYSGNLAVYSMVGNLQTEPFRDKRLTRKDRSSPYYILQVGSEDRDRTSPELIHNNTRLAFGWYDFVIELRLPGVVFVRRSYWNKDLRTKFKQKNTPGPGATRGHSSIAEGRNVVFAGELLFGGDEALQQFYVKHDKDNPYGQSPPGDLIKWTNKSGHYKVCNQFSTDQGKIDHAMSQTRLLVTDSGDPMLPRNKFEIFVDD